MIIGIDASNIGSGGGISHLKNILKYMLKDTSVSKVHIICKADLTKLLPKNELLNYKTFNFNYLIIISFVYQFFFYDSYFKKKKCDILFVPGGIYLGLFSPRVSLSQNLLPYDPKSIALFKSKFLKIKFRLIKHLQIYTFNNSDGIIFLHHYPKQIISKSLRMPIKTVVIPHGINKQNFEFSKKRIKNLLYVSDINAYKHQWILARSLLELATDEKIHLHLTLVGPSRNPYIDYLNSLKKEYFDFDKYITIVGEVKHNIVSSYLKTTDCFIYLSTCENLPISLLEAMSYGLPIITSNRKPMTSVVPSQNIFVDPTNRDSIKKGIKLMLAKKNLNKISKGNKTESLKYNWSESSIKTINFFKEVISSNNQHYQS